MDGGSIALLVAILSPLVGVPMTAITLYLRAIREHQTTGAADVARRIENIERCVRQVTRHTSEIERDYTTKEEWLRESMHARQQLERLTELMVRVQTELEDSRSLAAEIAGATAAIADMARRVVTCRGGCGWEKVAHGEERFDADQAGAQRTASGPEDVVSGGDAG
jgi:hypothetical protein